VTKFSVPTLKQLQAHLHEHSLQMASLRAALDIQVTRIAQMQAELDVLPQARKRRQLLRALLTKQSMDHGTRV
jgi:multidrug resistance efflux pump